MKSERFKRSRSVMATGAIAVVVAALAFGISSSVLGPKSAIARHLGFDLTSGSSSFMITSSTYATPSGSYPATSCSGTPALLYPAVTRCVVFSVHNNLKAAISIQSITTALDTTNYPAPPADCSGANLVLPTFSGSFNVAAGGDATSPGVPVELKDNGAPQNDCENYTYHFVYVGSANYTEVYGTSTALGSSRNPSTVGQNVTYTATVTASASASQDPVPSSPTGTVTFKDNGTTICNTVALTSTGTTTATAQCTVNYATTAGSPHPITASYVNTDGNFTNSSASLSQVVNPTTITTSSSLTSSPNPSIHGNSVTFTDTVSSGTGTPTGSVTFYSCTTSACTTKTSLGTGTLSSGKTTLSTSTLPVGTTYVEAVYAGSGNYLTSTSIVVSQVVTVSVPSFCPSNDYNAIIGNPWFPVIYGTNHSDFIHAFGGDFWINGFGGNDCIDAGDGNNAIFEADGNDVVDTGNGNNAVILGNGNDKVSLGNGSDVVEAGNGNDTITLGNGRGSRVFVGDGTDTVTVGSGPDNHVAFGRGSDSVTIQNGSSDDIDGGNGNETVFLGAGTGNSYSGQPHFANTCHLPKPPASWHGTAAAYYHDTITNCTVVTP